MEELHTRLLQLVWFRIVCVGLHGTETRTTDIMVHMQDKATVAHTAMRCEPPGDIRRWRKRMDSLEARITKTYRS